MTAPRDVPGREPVRIQRKRTRGWKMPEGAVSVTRPGKWGNPFCIGGWFKMGTGGNGFCYLQCLLTEYPTQDFTKIEDAAMAVEWFRRYKELYPPKDIEELRGKDLACFCHLCDAHKDGKPMSVECPDCAPCHVDVLLPIANRRLP